VSSRFEGAIINYHLMRLRLTSTAIEPNYFIHYVRGAKSVSNYIREVNHGATRDGINTEQLLGMPVALPPLAEQQRIVAEIERRLSVVAEVEAAVTANLKRAERLRQAILKRAFEGKLVPQDPSDEPASALLERIRREREKQGGKKAVRQARMEGME
jgi:type I restriction enzyme, S subunit